MVNNRGLKRVNFHMDCSHTNVIDVSDQSEKCIACTSI